MEFGFSGKVAALQTRLQAFMAESGYPNEKTYSEQVA